MAIPLVCSVPWWSAAGISPLRFDCFPRSKPPFSLGICQRNFQTLEKKPGVWRVYGNKHGEIPAAFHTANSNVDETIQTCIGTSDVLQYEWTIHMKWPAANLDEFKPWRTRLKATNTQTQPSNLDLKHPSLVSIHDLTMGNYFFHLFSSHVWWNQRVLCPIFVGIYYLCWWVCGSKAA